MRLKITGSQTWTAFLQTLLSTSMLLVVTRKYERSYVISFWLTLVLSQISLSFTSTLLSTVHTGEFANDFSSLPFNSPIVRSRKYIKTCAQHLKLFFLVIHELI
ncbi:hypothetical protein NA56DRAFT_352275 [Hyaloscypha hepaticicola]|uniref:Uncharacterized protein n=1 Tax=Hyaloscypha hepaticicola TaxID=2082293 RepID=A0A2J6PM92_9HELO|nr:hypothetical protein NA56DRAFT_352275 [Hyaloscypha hepaticicola]